ncbi:hypothetical protein CYMTET_23269 [Cymbomonas tetramitiformis]|uniref:Uncharacterized protein n=1 Tax=Cymbomonas tetramitiformis TaxID=36881 RepID=A0AAE0L1G6_9CHLO|nr:hypothetical protein CYMTET_23269 [Cymbomonas tetramitiformis]
MHAGKEKNTYQGREQGEEGRQGNNKGRLGYRVEHDKSLQAEEDGSGENGRDGGGRRDGAKGAVGPAVATSTGGSASGSPHAPGALKPDVGGVAGLGASVAGEDSSNLPGTAVTGPSAGRCTVMDPASSTVDDRRSVGQGGEDILQVSGRLIRRRWEGGGEGGGVEGEEGGGGEWRGGWWGVGPDMAGAKNNQPGGTGKAGARLRLIECLTRDRLGVEDGEVMEGGGVGGREDVDQKAGTDGGGVGQPEAEGSSSPGGVPHEDKGARERRKVKEIKLWAGCGAHNVKGERRETGKEGEEGIAATSCIDQGVCGGGGKVHDEGGKAGKEGREGVDDVVSPNESLAAIAGGILRLAHVLGGAGEEGAASVLQLTLGGVRGEAVGAGGGAMVGGREGVETGADAALGPLEERREGGEAQICRGVKGGEEIRGRGREEGVLQAAGKSRITSALRRGSEGLKPASSEAPGRDMSSRHRSGEELARSVGRRREKGPGGGEGAWSAEKRGAAGGGGGMAEERGGGLVCGEEGAEEGRGRNYSTKLVKVERLLSLRLALLLVLLLMEAEKKEGSREGSMSEPPGEVSTGERKKGGGEKEREERSEKKEGEGRGERRGASAHRSGEEASEATGVAAEEGGRGGEPGDTRGSNPRKEPLPDPKDLSVGPVLVVDEVVAHSGGGLDEVSDPMRTTVGGDEGSSEDNTAATWREAGSCIGEPVDLRELDRRGLGEGGEDNTSTRRAERDGEVKEVHQRANGSNTSLVPDDDAAPLISDPSAVTKAAEGVVLLEEGTEGDRGELDEVGWKIRRGGPPSDTVALGVKEEMRGETVMGASSDDLQGKPADVRDKASIQRASNLVDVVLSGQVGEEPCGICSAEGEDVVLDPSEEERKVSTILQEGPEGKVKHVTLTEEVGTVGLPEVGENEGSNSTQGEGREGGEGGRVSEAGLPHRVICRTLGG